MSSCDLLGKKCLLVTVVLDKDNSSLRPKACLPGGRLRAGDCGTPSPSGESQGLRAQGLAGPRRQDQCVSLCEHAVPGCLRGQANVGQTDRKSFLPTSAPNLCSVSCRRERQRRAHEAGERTQRSVLLSCRGSQHSGARPRACRSRAGRLENRLCVLLVILTQGYFLH